MKAKEISEKLTGLQQAIQSLKDPNAEQIVEELLNLVELLTSENSDLKQEVQKLKDEINRLKGEQGKPEIKPNKSKGKNISSEPERKKAEGETPKEGFKLDKSSLEKLKEKRIPGEILDCLTKLQGKRYSDKAEFLKTLESEIGVEATKLYGHILVKYARYKKRNRNPKIPEISIDREEICLVDTELLPEDAEFKGYKPKVVQDAIIKTDNVLFNREIFWSPSQQKTYIGEVPAGYEGDFGPNIKSQILSFKYINNMSIPKIKEFYENISILISESYISNCLTKKLDVFHREKSELYEASLEFGAWQQIDDTGSRVNGQNCYTHIVCNDLCTVFFTTAKKNRLTIIDILRNFESRSFVFNKETFELLKQLNISQKLIDKLLNETEQDKELNEKEIEQILDVIFPDPVKGKNNRIRIMEAAAISSYHSATGIPIVKVLVSDDAPQFKLITDEQMLCWIHDGRHYKKLKPVVPLHQKKLESFLDDYWEYYRKLFNYTQHPDHPDPEYAASLAADFDDLFSKTTGYYDLDDRIAKTKAKKENLLTVLKHPEIPLHNNRSENGARVEKRRADVSLQTKTDEGTKAKDTMMTIAESCKKLGVSTYQFIHDRISRTFNLPSLAELIKIKAQSKISP
jgi:hypothetical protein